MGMQLNIQGTTNKEYKLLYCDSKVHVLRVARQWCPAPNSRTPASSSRAPAKEGLYTVTNPTKHPA